MSLQRERYIYGRKPLECPAMRHKLAEVVENHLLDEHDGTGEIKAASIRFRLLSFLDQTGLGKRA